MPGTLEHSPADIVRYLLINLGLGTDPDDGGSWPIYASGEPSAPDSVITVYDTEGRQGGRVQVGGERQEFHGIQIRIRDPDHVGGFAKANAITIELDETVYQNSVSISDASGTGNAVYLVHAIHRVGGVIPLGKEVPKSKRSIFTINALAMLRQTS